MARFRHTVLLFAIFTVCTALPAQNVTGSGWTSWGSPAVSRLCLPPDEGAEAVCPVLQSPRRHRHRLSISTSEAMVNLVVILLVTGNTKARHHLLDAVSVSTRTTVRCIQLSQITEILEPRP